MRISVFCFGKMDFWTVFRFSAKRKDGGFSVILAGTRCVVNVGHFLVTRAVPPSFIGHCTKLWVIILAIGEWPEMPKVRDEPRKMTRTSGGAGYTSQDTY